MERMPLSLPAAKSPLESLHDEITTLNATPHLSDDVKWQQYENIFKRFFAFSKPTPTPMETSENDDDSSILLPLFSDPTDVERTTRNLYASLPKTAREKGLQLLKTIAQTPDVTAGNYQVSRTGQLIHRGQTVEGSNIMDLIHFAVRKKRNVEPPLGWTHFQDFLKVNNIPVELLALHHRKKKEKVKKRSKVAPLVVTPKTLTPPPRQKRVETGRIVKKNKPQPDVSLFTPTNVDFRKKLRDMPSRKQLGKGWSVVK